ncbi:MAG: hypothetical protein CMP22_05735 [Rickettsiales bacterium]|nr:hypothetical protein [Rickettsiales bacterium]
MKNTIALLSTIFFLTACGSTGQINSHMLNEQLKSGEARIIIERDNSLLYMAAPATVRSNGTKIASLGRGGSIVQNITEGRNHLTVGTPMSYGRSALSYTAKAGKTYYFTVSPRSEMMGKVAALGMIGDAIDAESGEQSGLFGIVPVEKEEGKNDE